MSSVRTNEYTEENTYYARICRSIVELCRDVLWEFLCGKIPAKDLPGEVIKHMGKLHKLHDDIKTLFRAHDANKTEPTKNDLDVTALYTICRNLIPRSKLKPPTNSWGQMPNDKDIKVADDVERIRQYRNMLYGHIKEAALSKVDYEKYAADLKGIFKRFDGRLSSKYEQVFENYQTCVMDPQSVAEYKELLLNQIEYDEETRTMILDLQHETAELKEDVLDLKGEVEQVQSSADTLGERMSDVEAQQTEVTKKIGELGDVQKQQSGSLIDITVNVSQDIHMTGARPKVLTDKQNVMENIEKDSDSGNKSVTKVKSYSEIVKADTNSDRRNTKSKDVEIKHGVSVNITNYNVTHVNAPDNIPGPKGTMYAALKNAVNNFKDGHFMLISCEMQRQTCLEQMALIPWTVVFDLDQNGRQSGLLSVVEEKLNARRSLYIHSVLEKTTNITESSTYWFNMHKHLDGNGKTDFGTWCKNKKISDGFKSIINNLKLFSDTYTRYRVIVFWPAEEENLRYVEKILNKLEKHFEPEVVIVDTNEAKSPYSSSVLSNFKVDLKDRLRHFKLMIEEFCDFVSRSLSSEQSPDDRKFILPVSEFAMDCTIDQRQASWLQEVFEVLFKDKQYDASSVISRTLEKELDNFYRGGTLPWYVRYELGADSVDAERDLMKDIITQIKQLKREHKSKIIRINHPPGCGGTTLAQRILWEMRDILPCVQVRPREGYIVHEVEQRLELIYKKTDLPLLVLLDGEDEYRVKDMMDSLENISVIALCVNRYPYPMAHTGLFNDEYWLDTYVSQKESNTIALRLGQHCNNKKKRENINKLNEAVKEKKKIAIFEFGLAAYAHEYAGLASYVSGFLQLQQNKAALKPWHHALAYLSFAYYYGQSGIPCQYFAAFLQIGEHKVPNIHDFPKEMQALIVPDTADRKRNVIRVSHYFIAKEILEQIIPWPNPRSKVRKAGLIVEDRRDLEKIAINFIKHAESVDNKTHSPAITSLLTKSFISRENELTDVKKTGKEKRKSLLSSILTDLDNKPPHTSRFGVYKQLIKSFPNEAPFHAQLGRLYTILRPEYEEEAEKQFRKALQLCHDKVDVENIDEIPRSMRLTLMMTNHMYGRMFSSRVEKFTGRSSTDKPAISIQKNEFPVVVRRLLKDVKSACRCYELCRYYNPEDREHFQAYEQEICTRLMFCEFVSRNSESKNILAFIHEKEGKKEYAEICEFVKECVQEVDCLFLEYFSSWSDPDDINPSFSIYQRWYTSLFKKKSPGYLTKNEDSIQTRRLYISQMKVETGDHEEYGDLMKIDSLKEILSIITAYEKNFCDYQKGNQKCSKRDIDIDYLEWLVAIRHRKIQDVKSVEEVLQEVEQWNKTLNTPNSKFYVFILKSILGFGNATQQGNTRLLLEANDLRGQLKSQSRYIRNARRPREWLGLDEGFRCLAWGSRYSGQRDRSINESDLALFKGTICHPNKSPRSGAIDIDLGYGRSADIKAFFVPLIAGMSGASFAGRRVEFCIGFSFLNGYEAFFLKELKKVKCPKRKIGIVITSRDKRIICPAPCEYAFAIS